MPKCPFCCTHWISSEQGICLPNNYNQLYTCISTATCAAANLYMHYDLSHLTFHAMVHKSTVLTHSTLGTFNHPHCTHTKHPRQYNANEAWQWVSQMGPSVPPPFMHQFLYSMSHEHACHANSGRQNRDIISFTSPRFSSMHRFL